MIRHIVMWKLDDCYSEAEKKEKAEAFGTRLMNLVGIIPEIREFSVHYNSKLAPDSNYDLVLDSSFDSIEEMNTYQNHPEHVAVVEFGKSIKKERACIDFEF